MTLRIPQNENEVSLRAGRHDVHLTNLNKLFWPELGLAKRDLLQYYATIAPVLVPHLQHRAMVMKRYPNGAHGEFFYMKRTPAGHPAWLRTCSIPHASGSVIAFPVIDDMAALLWVVNLGCIDLNPWYSPCDDFNRPDFLHFDLDPGPAADFTRVRKTALMVRDKLASRKIVCYAKTSGASGMHVYIPIVRGPLQKEVWTVAKRFAQALAGEHPELITAEYRIAKRPPSHVLVDYNQNVWGRTLASVYSVRPESSATVSTPVTWSEVERGFRREDFRIDNVPARVAKLGDLWRPLRLKAKRCKLEKLA